MYQANGASRKPAMSTILGLTLIIVVGLVLRSYAQEGPGKIDNAQPINESLSDSRNLFVVFGIVYESDGITDWGTRGRIIVVNARSGARARSGIGATESGKYAAAFVDYVSNLAVCVGDTLEFVIPAGELITPSKYVLTSEDVTSGRLRYDILAHPIIVSSTALTWGRIKALYVR